MRGAAFALALAILAAAAFSSCGGTSKTKAVDPDDAGFPPRDVDASVPLPDAGCQPPLPCPGTTDAGYPDSGTPDAGQPDAGTPDAGMPDAGMPDAGHVPPPPPVLVPPKSSQVEHFSAPGLLQVSADDGGYIWAVSNDALYLLRPGATKLEVFQNHGSAVGSSGHVNKGLLSVAGAGPGEAWVGYAGEFTHGEADDPSVPLSTRESGGADHFFTTPTGIQLDRHVMFWTPPGVLHDEPTGRWKVRSIYTIVVNRGPGGVPGDVFFGGTHGVGIVYAKNGAMDEHQHAGWNYCITPDPGSCTLLAGDHHGVAVHPSSGNVWIGADFAASFLSFNEDNPAHGWGRPRIYDPGAPFDKAFRVWEGRSVDTEHPEWNGRDFVNAMAFDAYGDLWIGSYYNGIARARIRQTTIPDPVPSTDPKHPKPPLYAGQALGRDGKFRAMSQDDLDYWNHRFGKMPPWPGYSRAGGIHDFIWTLAGDTDGSVWVGGPDGAWRIQAATGQWMGYQSVIPRQNVSGISIDPRPGVRAVYFAAASGLYIYRGP